MRWECSTLSSSTIVSTNCTCAHRLRAEGYDMPYDDFDKPGINKPLIGAVAAVAAAAVGGWLYWRSHQAPLPAVSAGAQPEAAAPPPEARIEHPVPAGA